MPTLLIPDMFPIHGATVVCNDVQIISRSRADLLNFTVNVSAGVECKLEFLLQPDGPFSVVMASLSGTYPKSPAPLPQAPPPAPLPTAPPLQQSEAQPPSEVAPKKEDKVALPTSKNGLNESPSLWASAPSEASLDAALLQPSVRHSHSPMQQLDLPKAHCTDASDSKVSEAAARNRLNIKRQDMCCCRCTAVDCDFTLRTHSTRYGDGRRTTDAVREYSCTRV